MAATADRRIDVVHDGRVLPVELFETGRGPGPAVLVISEIFGLNDDIRRIARRFADHGYTAAAPDLYRGGHWMRCAWRAIGGLQLSSTGGRAAHELEAALQALEARDDVTAAGAVGFCMGGGFAMLLGTMGTCKATGAFYGTVPVMRRMEQRMCPVVGGFGGKDPLFAREGRKLKAALTELEVPHDVEIYEHCGHSFMSHQDDVDPVNLAVGRALMAVGYDEAAAEDSWTRMLAFFAEHLGPPARTAP